MLILKFVEPWKIVWESWENQSKLSITTSPWFIDRKKTTPPPLTPAPHLDFLTVSEITDAGAAARVSSCPQNARRVEILLGLNIYRI